MTVPSLTHFAARYFSPEDGDAYVCDSTADMTHTPEDLTLPPSGSYLSIYLSNTSLLIHPCDCNDELYRIYSRNSRHRVIHAQWMAEEGHSVTPTGKIRRPSIELMFSWIVRAWDMVDQRVIVTSFLKTGISNALDGSEDDALWQTEQNVDEESE